MPTPNLVDVINGATPLEFALAEVHPRVHLSPRKLEVLRGRMHQEPWATMLKKVRKNADGSLAWAGKENTTGAATPGSSLPHLALTYLTTGDKSYLEAARALMRATTLYAGPEAHGYFGGCWLWAMGLAYDWLYHDLDAQTLADTRAFIEKRGRPFYELLAKYETIMGTWYTGNHLPNFLYDLSAGGMAIYNDVPNMGPWLRLVTEKARQMIHALGPDGVSPEGICYGGFYTETLVQTLDLVKDLMGVDLFAQSPWLANTWAFHHYSMLPRSYWWGHHLLMSFGDAVHWNWSGPDSFLFRLAAYHGNGHAQWFALETLHSGLTGADGHFLNPICYDPGVPATPPGDLPTLRHFEDQGLVAIRSGWDGKESLFQFRCAAFCGHHTLANYNNDSAGGHMHPDAGSFQLFAHGNWLINDAGYCPKLTAYRNTITVNGIGQTGEKSMWFEGVELRRERREPRIIRVEEGNGSGGSGDSGVSGGHVIISADLTPAYEHAAKATRIVRHVVHFRPDYWVILDQVAAQEPSTFDVYFHSERPFAAAAGGAYLNRGEHGALTLTPLAPTGIDVHLEKQKVESIGGVHGGHEIHVLRLNNPAKRAAALFVTVLETHPASTGPAVAATLEHADDQRVIVVVRIAAKDYQIELPGEGAPLRVTRR